MKKFLLAIAMLAILAIPNFAMAAETSSDTMILDWKPTKVWMNGTDLCMSGEFENQRDDLTVTKLLEFTAIITFTAKDGTKYQFVGQPQKLPMIKIAPNGTKKVTFNFGPFNGEWESWNTQQSYTFSYVNRVSF